MKPQTSAPNELAKSSTKALTKVEEDPEEEVPESSPKVNSILVNYFFIAHPKFFPHITVIDLMILL